MSYDTVSSASAPSSIFNIGDVLGRLGESAISTFEQIAPIWTAQQLGLQEQNNKKEAITFQDQLAKLLKSGQNLTTEPNANPNGTAAGGVTLSTNTILLIAGGALLGLILLQQN